MPRGGPDGGDGGDGGDVVVAAADRTLATSPPSGGSGASRPVRGGNGRGSKKHGAAGEPIRATACLSVRSCCDDETGALVADLAIARERVVVARGGRGGLGNVRFATSDAPDATLRGDRRCPATSRRLTLELRLKLVVDVALARPAERRQVDAAPRGSRTPAQGGGLPVHDARARPRRRRRAGPATADASPTSPA